MAAQKLTSMPAGVYVHTNCPFNKDGSLDEGGLRAHLRWLARERIGAGLASAGAGEGWLMTEEETWRVHDIGVQELKGKVPVIGANLAHSTAEANIKFAREAEARGLDAIQVYPPAPGDGWVASEEILNTFYEKVLSAVTMPVMLSSNLSTGYEVPMQVHAKLLDKYPQIIGFNKYHNSPDNLAQFLRLIGPRKPVFTAGAQLLISYALGGKGENGSAANLTPRLCRSFFDSFMAGDLNKAKECYSKLLQVSHVLGQFRTSGSPTTKAALNILGLPGGYPRAPMLPLNEASQKTLAHALDELGIRKLEGL